MTDSDDLRGDPNHDPTRRHHPELRELDNLRALLRPWMVASGDTSHTEALRGILVEFEAHDDIQRRLAALLIGIAGGHHGGGSLALLDEVESAVKRMGEDVLLERKLARAAADGHDHCRELLMEIAGVFGRVDDLGTLPGMVRATHADRGALHANTVELSRRIDEMKQALTIGAKRREDLERQLDQLTTLIGNAAKEVGVLCEGRMAVDILPDLLADMKRRMSRLDHRLSQAEYAAKTRGDALKVLGWDGDEHPEAWAPRLHRRIAAPLPTLPASLDAIRESPCPTLDEACHVRTGQPRFLTVDQKMEVWLIEPTALPGYMISGRNDRWQWNNDAHGTCIAGYRSAAEAIAGARENSKTTQSKLGLERWAKICEAFGFDPEEDPPVSIPAILAGDQWTNSRRVLADACGNLRAPSLKVILGELVQALSKARGVGSKTQLGSRCTACARRLHEGEKAVQGCADCYWLEFGDPPVQTREDAAEVASARPARPSTARCPVCHRMAEVEGGRFQKHMSGDRICSGTASDLPRDEALRVLSDIINRIRLVVAQAGVVVVHKPDPLATMPPPDAQDLLNKLRDVLSVPDGQSIMDHARHAAKGMQALAILGWQSGSPIEWATARAAADAELRSAFAEAQLVGTDHAAMVRELWGDLRSLSERAKVRTHEHDATVRELGLLRSMNAELCTAMDGWRKWAIGKDIDIKDSLTSDEIRTIFDMHEQESRRLTDERIDGLQTMLGEREEEIERLKHELHEASARAKVLSGLVDVLRNIKRQLNTLADLSP